MSNRVCGTCGLCCRLLDVPELDKPHGTWCQHCDPGHGCRIHSTRPQICRDYQCGWLEGFYDDAWFPARAKIIVDHVFNDGAMVMRFTVDPSYPGRWRDEPYHGEIRKLARQGLKSGKWRTVVSVGGHWTLILGDKEVPYQAGTLVRAADGQVQLQPLQRAL